MQTYEYKLFVYYTNALARRTSSSSKETKTQYEKLIISRSMLFA